jgi:feruloyl esterase
MPRCEDGHLPCARTGWRAAQGVRRAHATRSGQPLYFNWTWGRGIGDRGGGSWKLGTSTTATPNSSFATLIQDATAYEFFTPPDPSYSIFNYNFDTDPARMGGRGCDIRHLGR